MDVIATVSVEEAGEALGLKPPAVRGKIKSGALAAAFISRRWRVHVDSLNALLACPVPVRNPPIPVKRWATRVETHASRQPEAHAVADPSPIIAAPSPPIAPRPGDPFTTALGPVELSKPPPPPAMLGLFAVPIPPPPPAPTSLFSDSDMRWITQHRSELWSKDSRTRENAEFQLSMFAKSAMRDPTRVAAAGLTPEQAATFIQAMLDRNASLPKA